MSFAAIFALAVGVALDATAVAAARGLAAPRVRVRDACVVGLMFGGAQAIMPLAGWWTGARLGHLVAAWDHWVAFVLLAAIGGKMLWDTRRPENESAEGDARRSFDLRALTILAIATSIDAFAVGITLPLIGAPLVLSVVTMGFTTAFASGAAAMLGKHLGARVGRRLDAVGGVVLIAVGAKILFDHLRGG